MKTRGTSQSLSAGLLIAGILLVAANLRPVLTSVGPLLDQIGADTGLGTTALGVLAAVPLLAFGAVSPLAHGLSEKFGVERTVFGALMLLVAGTFLRPVPGAIANLWIGTFLVGAAIAVCNVMLPALLKRDFPGRMATLTGAYSAVLGGCASLGAGLAVPLALLPVGGGAAGWRFALTAFVVLAVPAVLLWLPRLRRGKAADERARAAAAAPALVRGSVWKSGLAWHVTVYMGLQSMTFYILITWLPTLERFHGRGDLASGWDLMLFQLIGVVSSLLTPVALRGPTQLLAASLPPLLVVAGGLGMMLMPQVMLFWVLVAGFGCGSSLVTALSLFGLRTRTHREAGALSGMAQSIGYLLAAAGPPIFGGLFAATGAWETSLALLCLIAVAQAAIGLLVGRDRFAFTPVSPTAPAG